jgi:hypothetical protein
MTQQGRSSDVLNSTAWKAQDCSSAAQHSWAVDYNPACHHSHGQHQAQVTSTVAGTLQSGCNYFCPLRALGEQEGTKLTRNHTHRVHSVRYDYRKHSG